MASTASARQAADQARASFDEAHARLLADGSIQFELDPYRFQPPPAWISSLLELLRDAFPLIRILFWAAVAALALFLLYHLARRLAGEKWPWKRSKPAPAEDSWRPEEAPARALLASADQLAADGCFAQAAHLLLFRSIEEIDARRPRLVRPALTSRDIAGAPDIPDGARRAFSLIVFQVEQSLFGGKALLEREWRQCRSAYEEFAFAQAWKS